LLASGAIGALYYVPWPVTQSIPGIVEYAPLTPVRVGSAGFVREVLVASDEHVDAGQLLAVIENREVQAELADLDLQISQSEMRARVMHHSGELAKLQVERKQRESLLEKRAELEKRLAAVEVRAPASGRIISRNLEELVGQYVKLGTEIMAIGTEDDKELVISVAQGDAAGLAARIGQPVRARILGQPSRTIVGRLVSLHPAASELLPHAALGAHAGGPLDVEHRKEGASDDVDPDQLPFRLTQPRFEGRVALEPAEAVALHAGCLAGVSSGGEPQSVAEHLRRAFLDYLSKKLEGTSLSFR